MATCPECLFLPQATAFDGTQGTYKDMAFKRVELQTGVESKEAGETFHAVNVPELTADGWEMGAKAPGHPGARFMGSGWPQKTPP